jgi:Na+/H+-dicarboxylate symporter
MMVAGLARRWFAIVLWKRILAAMVLGAVAGLLIGDQAESIKWIGDVFIRLIRMLIVPLVFVTLVAGVTAIQDPKRLGSIGLRTIVLYMATTLAAIVIGLLTALILRPGAGIDLSGAVPRELDTPVPLADRLISIVPENPFAAFADGNILAVIFFAIVVGSGIMVGGRKTRRLSKLFDSASELMLIVTTIVMEVAPFGVFALVAWVMGTLGLETFARVSLLAIGVYAGCLLHMVLVQGGIVKFFARLPMRRFFQGARGPQLVAFSTSSSSATLPVTLAAADHNLGIKPAVASSVLPLGATINMDGTALYVAMIAVFSAQVFGIPLDFTDYALIALTTTLVSIGTASVPSASLFLMAAVLETIGVSPAQIALVIGFILPFDRILDMMRTVTNVTGDLSVATVVAHWEGEIDREVFLAPPET